MIRSGYLRLCIFALLLGAMLLAAGCETSTEGVWLCSIKTDGTGFQKILKNEYIWNNWQRWNDLIRVYPAPNGKLVLMYSDGLKVYDQNTLNLTTIFEGNHDWSIVWSDSGYYMKRYGNIVFALDGSKAYYTVDGKLVELDLTTYQTLVLYDYPYKVYYPVIDEAGTKLVMQGDIDAPSPGTALLTYHLDSGVTDVLADVLAHKACISNSRSKLIFTMNNNIRSMNTDGTGLSTLYTAPDTTAANNEPYLFIPFNDGNSVVTTNNTLSGNLIILNTQDGSTQVVGSYSNTFSFSDLANQTVGIDHLAASLCFVSNSRIQRYSLVDRGVETILSPTDLNSPETYLWIASGWDDDRIYFIGDYSSSLIKSAVEPEAKAFLR